MLLEVQSKKQKCRSGVSGRPKSKKQKHAGDGVSTTSDAQQTKGDTQVDEAKNGTQQAKHVETQDILDNKTCVYYII